MIVGERKGGGREESVLGSLVARNRAGEAEKEASYGGEAMYDGGDLGRRYGSNVIIRRRRLLGTKWSNW